jgi:hypothetical protein
VAENEDRDEAEATPSIDPRYVQRMADYRQNLANRLFPGPSDRMSKQLAKHIDGLLRPLETDNPGQRRGGRSTTSVDAPRRSRQGSAGGGTEPLNVATPEDIAQVRETLEKQTELLQAILASSVDTQNDARSTAQNSRTFAWAGTAIALLTLIATVLSIIAAVNAH